MSTPETDNKEISEPASCVNCGQEENDEVKLKGCVACKLVKYCNRDCQIAHRPQHKKACTKRAAELHEELLFKQPPKREDCPICFLMLPEGNMAAGQSYELLWESCLQWMSPCARFATLWASHVSIL
jgi:hypothetical protein